MKKSNLRQNEADCLNKIKNDFLYSKGIKKAFDNSNYSTMESILSGSRQNEKHSEFPDFFFNGGIIEHFQVTASNQTPKGSRYKIDDACRQRENEKYFRQFDKELMESPYCPGTITTQTVKDVYEFFSYEFFVESFKRNVEHHLKSLRNSEYTNQVVVFLIELESASLCIYVDDTFSRFYKLSEDRKLLQYIKETLTDVNYIIFSATNAYEIIDLSKIDFIINKAKDNLDIRCGKHTNISVKFYLDL